MQFDDVLLGRRSIRGYKPDPVPKALIEEILALAMRSPVFDEHAAVEFYGRVWRTFEPYSCRKYGT